MFLGGVPELTWDVFFVGFMCICITLYYYYATRYYPTLPHKSRLNTCSKEEFISGLNNGDLVFFDGNSKGERICKHYTESPFSHVGMIFKEQLPGTQQFNIYIWESDLGDSYRKGPRVISLKQKIKNNKCDIIGWRSLFSNGVPKPKTKDILKIVDEHRFDRFDNTMITWWTANYPNIHRLFENKKEFFCSSLVAYTLMNLGILDKNRLPSWYSPKDFLKGIKLRDGYFYSSVKYMLRKEIK